eukprot:5154822-Alexandrium_andersonii.AAC.1
MFFVLRPRSSNCEALRLCRFPTPSLQAEHRPGHETNPRPAGQASGHLELYFVSAISTASTSQAPDTGGATRSVARTLASGPAEC